MAGHANAKTTGLYDRRTDDVSLDEVERIGTQGGSQLDKRVQPERRFQLMSIFVGEVLADGIVFAADKNITISKLDGQGNVVSTVQEPGSKILRWPKRKALLGYVGCGQVGGQTMQEWLYDFMGEHIEFTEPEVVANEMRDRLQSNLGGPGAAASIVQFATFARREGHIVPEFWHITNIHGLTATGDYDPPSDSFIASERLLGVHLNQASPANIRGCLRSCANQFRPFWFHQGLDLAVFNTLSEAVRQAFVALQGAGHLPPPQTLADWERHARMLVLIYGAYFEAFGAPGQRYVGGGADVLSIPWPQDL